MDKNKKNIPYMLFIVLLALDVVIMLIQKIAANQAQEVDSLFYISLLTQPLLWIGLGLAPFQLLVWTKILACTELSIAYPISSFSYPLTMLAAQFVLGEHLNFKVWIGALLITLGVAIVGSRAGKNIDMKLPKHLSPNLP